MKDYVSKQPLRRQLRIDASAIQVGDVVDRGAGKSMLVERIGGGAMAVVLTGVQCYSDGFVPARRSPQRAQIKRGSLVRVKRLVKT